MKEVNLKTVQETLKKYNKEEHASFITMQLLKSIDFFDHITKSKYDRIINHSRQKEDYEIIMLINNVIVDNLSHDKDKQQYVYTYLVTIHKI